MFKMNLEYLIQLYAPLDNQITASSVSEDYYNASENADVPFEYLATGEECGWVPSEDDSSPWIKFDFLQSYVAVGVLFVKSCGFPIFNMSSSADDVTWSSVGTKVGLDAVYEGIRATWWFEKEVSARYWKFEPDVMIPLKAEILGYSKTDPGTV